MATPTQGVGVALAKTAQVSVESQIGCDVAEGWPVVTHQFANGAFLQTNLGFMIVVP